MMLSRSRHARRQSWRALTATGPETMPRVQLEDLVDHLDFEMRAALRAALREVLPDADVDDEKLYLAFKMAVRHGCDRWERVPQRCVRA
jgi:hypothetical protein